MAVAAFGLAGRLAAYPLAGAGPEAPAELTLAGLGLVGLAFALTVAPAALALALVALAAEYMTHQLARGLPPASAIGYGAGLLVLCELATWSTTFPASVSVEATVVARRGLAVVGTALAAALVSLVSLLGGSVDAGSALVAVLVGVAGSVGLLAAAFAAERTSRREKHP